MKKIFLLSLFLLTSLSWAQTSPSAKESGLPALMHFFYGSLQQLRPYMTSLDDFKSEKNRESLKSLLKSFEAKIEENEPKEIAQSPGFNMTYPLMARHLRDIIHLYDNGIYEQAWQKLNATTNFCVACHTRLPRKIETQAFLWSRRGSNIVEPQDLRDAEFYFVSHNYNAAMEIFDQAIASHSDPKEMADLKSIFDRKLAFLVRVQRDPGLAIEALKRDSKNGKLPPEILGDIKVWIGGFETWKKEKKDFSKLSENDLVKAAKKAVEEKTRGRTIAIGDPDRIELLRISGALYERLFKGKDSPQVPELLFYLAQIERDLASIRYYSLSDVYLKECVLQYPKAPIARRCFEEYSLSMKQRFGGVTPEFITNSIETLGKVLETPSTK